MKFTPARKIESLGDGFYDVVAPADFPQTILRYRNQRAAKSVGLDTLTDDQWVLHFGRFAPLPGSLPQPLALRYHGHQFRNYNPDIGDGRGFLFAQMRDPEGRLLDLGTKGSGQTPWSRFGDGRLTLKGGVREVLATEMLEALGVNTSKSFSLIETGEALSRNDEPSPTRSAVLVRLSHSHIRYGTFQRLAAYEDKDNMARLVDYCLRNFYDVQVPDCVPDQVAVLLGAAVASAADLAASYMAAGFVHGVLNTDNINITGESFDYGPYRFAPSYDLGFTAAYFDHGGLYAFGRQAEALHWNIYQLGKALLTLVGQSVVIPALESFPGLFEQALVTRIFARLGIRPHIDTSKNLALLAAMETALGDSQVDLAQFYFDMFGGTLAQARRSVSPAQTHYKMASFLQFFEQLDAFEPVEDISIRLRNDYFAKAAPCNMLIDEIESIWARIASADDWSLFNAKISDIQVMAKAYRVADRRS
jgi:serine/tyrosine/threonine adenylyltransferase